MPVRFLLRPILTLAGAAAFLLAMVNPAAAPPGDLDPTFGGDGKVTTDFVGELEFASGVAVQGDGKIVAAGETDCDFALARYNSDGSLDPTFGSDGRITTDFAGGCDTAYAVAIQWDGKIVAAGYAVPLNNSDLALARYNLDGSLDPTFGGDGKVTTNFGSYDYASALAIQGDGKIVAVGFASTLGNYDEFALARYNPDGSLDPTFGGDGKVTTVFAAELDRAFAVAIQGDGKIVAAGFSPVSGSYDFALARYQPDGSLDPTFGGDGKATTDFAGGSDGANAVAIQGDGRVVAAGHAGVLGRGDFALARYQTDGSLDPSFGGDGKVATDFAGSADRARALAIQGDGKIVAAGSAVVSGRADFALARYNSDGSLDPTFGGDGRVTTNISGGEARANALAIQRDGKIVAAGEDFGVGTHEFVLTRYTVCRRTSRPSAIPFCP